MTAIPTPLPPADQQIIEKQVASWDNEVFRQQDLIAAASPSPAGAPDPMPKRTAFIAWCKSRHLDTESDKDAWGVIIFKHAHIQSMWEGWFNAPAVAPQSVSVPEGWRDLIERTIERLSKAQIFPLVTELRLALAAAPLPQPQADAKNSPLAYCDACQAVGMSNCGNFNECAGARCITCKQQLNPLPVSAVNNAEQARFERMFMEACADLGLINEALGLDPNDGGAEPILDAIEELKAATLPQQGEGSIDTPIFRALLADIEMPFRGKEREHLAALVNYIDSWHSARLARTAAPDIESIASNHDAMIILTDDFTREQKIKAVDAHMKRQLARLATPLRYTSDGELAECPCCGSLDVGGGHNTVHCYVCKLSLTAPGPLQNAIDKWNRRTAFPVPSTAAPSELRNAFMTLESADNSDGRSIVLKFNRRDDAYAVHDFLLKVPVKESPAPAPLEGQAIPTDLSKRLRAASTNFATTLFQSDILAAADEIDRLAALATKGGAA